MGILALILTLLLVVGLHEAGHAVMARIFNIKIKRIAIGFGKPVWQWTGSSGCEWRIGRWPLGGYVHLANTRISPESPKDYAHCFDKQAVWKRVLVLLSGSVANVLGAWCALVIVFYVGIYHKAPVIQTVDPKSTAAQAGIVAGDRIVAISGQRTVSWQSVGQELIILWGQADVPITVQIAGSQQVKKVHLNLSHVPFTKTKHFLLASLGITPNSLLTPQKESAASFLMAIKQTNQELAHLVYFFLMTLKQLILGVIPFSLLLGPLGLLHISIASLAQGALVFLYFIATLGLAVGVINLFPIPGLDGGGILYALIEKVRAKPISIALELLIYRFALIVAFLLLAQLIKNDLNQLGV